MAISEIRLKFAFSTLLSATVISLFQGGCAAQMLVEGHKNIVDLTAGGASTKVVSSSAVASCQLLGEVVALPPFYLPTDAPNNLRNKSAELGADTVVFTRMLLAPARADAYRCAPI